MHFFRHISTGRIRRRTFNSDTRRKTEVTSHQRHFTSRCPRGDILNGIVYVGDELRFTHRPTFRPTIVYTVGQLRHWKDYNDNTIERTRYVGDWLSHDRVGVEVIVVAVKGGVISGERFWRIIFLDIVE